MNYLYLAIVGVVCLALFAWSAVVYFRQIWGSGYTAQDWDSVEKGCSDACPDHVEMGSMATESVMMHNPQFPGRLEMDVEAWGASQRRGEFHDMEELCKNDACGPEQMEAVAKGWGVDAKMRSKGWQSKTVKTCTHAIPHGSTMGNTEGDPRGIYCSTCDGWWLGPADWEPLAVSLIDAENAVDKSALRAGAQVGKTEAVFNKIRYEMMPRVASLKQTCFACPSQWEGMLEDGRMLYIRYRGGDFSVGIAALMEDAFDDDAIVFESNPEPADGEWSMTVDEMKRETESILNWSGVEVVG